ncbi:hypothetical protein [Hymenobacter weizhouensis]|nr:hypothetical protein [Hymenobacter sp. YIM 151500-1]UYZ64896.1 hypothetical protein OIS53_08600 [Hymenobacter sp. YIM 151500-1]
MSNFYIDHDSRLSYDSTAFNGRYLVVGVRSANNYLTFLMQ